MDQIEKLKILLLEDKYPYFDIYTLDEFLKENNNDVYKTASELCYLKADGDTSVKVGPIEIESPGSAFWVQLAVQYLEKSKKLNASGNSSSTTGYKTRMRRC